MADVHTQQQRRYNMQQIRSTNTRPEMLVRRYLHAHGFRYKLNDKTLPGKPDLVLPKYRTVIFVHGCFWHGHANCRYFKIPQTRTQWWTDKITRNQTNDAKAPKALKKLGWKVIVVRECGLKKGRVEKTLEKLSGRIMNIFFNP
jgi:DNA mismatch endonuclease, patch repair protein